MILELIKVVNGFLLRFSGSIFILCTHSSLNLPVSDTAVLVDFLSQIQCFLRVLPLLPNSQASVGPSHIPS